MALWALKLNFKRYESSEMVRNLYLRCKVIDSIMPKVINSSQKIQENALLALAILVQDIELRNALISLAVVPHIMQIGIQSEAKLNKDEFSDALSFGQILSSLLYENYPLQQQLMKEYDVMNLCFNMLLKVKSKQLGEHKSESYKIQDIYIKCLRRLLDYEENLQ